MLLNLCFLFGKKTTEHHSRVCIAIAMLVMGAPFGFGVREKRSKRAKGVITKRTVGALSRALLHKHPKSMIWLMFGTQLAV